MTAARRALIVGGTRGIGRALADAWCRAGRQVAVIGRTAAETAHDQPWVGWSVDLRDASALRARVAQIVAAAGPIDDLVFAQRARQMSDAWSDEIATSLTGTATVMSALEGTWSAARRPAVVVVGSLAARMVLLEQPAAYHVAKAGLDELTRYYAVALAQSGVRVNAVAPGVVLQQRSGNAPPTPTDEQRAYLRAIPLGRLAGVADVVDAIDFLCSERAAYITGQTLVIDGGLSLIMQHSLAAALLRDGAPGSSAATAPEGP